MQTAQNMNEHLDMLSVIVVLRKTSVCIRLIPAIPMIEAGLVDFNLLLEAGKQ